LKHRTHATCIARITAGKLTAVPGLLYKEFESMKDGDVRVTVEAYVRPKTWEQLKAFHGVIVPQVKAFIEDREGMSYTVERIKDDLKNTFLSKVKQYYSDGTPVMIKMAHPDKKNVSYLWHMEIVPSLADLKVDEMNQFISDIIAHFWETHGESIVIEPK
jgi:uncharacterized membrane protein YheB (UPF0754 family)